MRLAIKDKTGKLKPRARARLKDAVEFYLRDKGLTNVKHDIVLIVMDQLDEGEGAYGSYVYKKTSSDVELKLRWLPNMLQTLFHELTHMDQHVRGDLFCGTAYNVWKGKELPLTNFKKNFSSYFNSPWEIEARAEELRLIREFHGSRLFKTLGDLLT